MSSPENEESQAIIIKWTQPAKSVSVEGSWDQYNKKWALQQTLYGEEGTIFMLEMVLKPGKYLVRFLVNDEYQVDSSLTRNWINGNEYNVISVGTQNDGSPTETDDVIPGQTKKVSTQPQEGVKHFNHNPEGVSHSISAPCSPRSNRRRLGRSSVPTTPPLHRRNRRKKKKKSSNGPDIDAIREEVVKREQEWREAWILQERRHHHIREHEKQKLRAQFKEQRAKWLSKIQEFHKGSKDLNNQVEGLKTKLETCENGRQLAESSWNKRKNQYTNEIKFFKEQAEKMEKMMGHEIKKNKEQVVHYKTLLEKKEEYHTEKVTELTKADDQNTRLVIKVNQQLEDAQKSEEAMEKQLEESEEKARKLAEELTLKKKEVNELDESLLESQNRHYILKRKLEAEIEVLISSKETLSATNKHLENEMTILKQGQEKKAENNAMIQAMQQQLDEAHQRISSLNDELQTRKAKVTKMENKLLDDKNIMVKLHEEKINTFKMELKEKNEINSSLNEELVKVKQNLSDIKANNESISSKMKTIEEESKKIQLDNKSHFQELSSRSEKLEADNKILKEKYDQQILENDKQKSEIEHKLLERQSVLNKISSELEEVKSQHALDLGIWKRKEIELEKQLQRHERKGSHLYSKLSILQEHVKILRSVQSKLKDKQLESNTYFTRNLQKAGSTLLTLFKKQNLALKQTMTKYKKELSARRKYFNLVQELRGNIRVFCRVRPMLPSEKKNKEQREVITYPKDEDKGQERSLLLRTKKKSHHQETKTSPFEFDRVFSPTATQEEVFSDTKFLIQSVMDGYNVCIFAYGQTGSGKTYTIEGSQSDPGVNTRALKELFRIKKERQSDYSYKIKISMLEIYNEQIRDLLVEQKPNPWDETIQPKIRKSARGMFIDGLKEWRVESLEDVVRGIIRGKSNRSTGVTKMNEHSSRSHMLLSVQVHGRNNVAGINHFGKLHLIDLAGSERLSRSGAKGERLNEAKNINKSLAALGDVIEALQKKSSHVPYRNSKLTYMLQDSLGGHAKTLMFINVSPASLDADETNCSLNFATRVRQVELGKSVKNITYDKPSGRSQYNKNNDKTSVGKKKSSGISSSSKRGQRNQ